MSNVFQKHQVAIARKTLAMSDAMVDVLGGMTKDEARRILGEDCAREYLRRYGKAHNPARAALTRAVNKAIAEGAPVYVNVDLERPGGCGAARVTFWKDGAAAAPAKDCGTVEGAKYAMQRWAYAKLEAFGKLDTSAAHRVMAQIDAINGARETVEISNTGYSMGFSILERPGGCGAARNSLERVMLDAQTDADRNNIALTVWNLNRFSPLYVIRTYRDGDENRDQFVAKIEPAACELEVKGGCGAARTLVDDIAKERDLIETENRLIAQLRPIERNHAVDNAAAWYADIKDKVASLSSLDRDQREWAKRDIHEGPLSVLVRDGWRSPHAPSEDGAEEYEILLSTGGPALRLYGRLNEHGEPNSAALQYQNWGTPWTDWYPDGEREGEWGDVNEVARVLLAYAYCFSFGE